MTKKTGSGRGTPPRLRLINDETEVEKYKRQGWDPRKTYAENMGHEGVFDRPGEEFDPSGRYENDGAPDRQTPNHATYGRAARNLAAQGRGADTEIAHFAPGEYVIPAFLQTPELMDIIRREAIAQNIPFESLFIGNRRNRINPRTGAPEFGGLGPDDEQAPGEQPPYRYEGPDVDGITVTPTYRPEPEVYGQKIRKHYGAHTSFLAKRAASTPPLSIQMGNPTIQPTGIQHLRKSWPERARTLA